MKSLLLTGLLSLVGLSAFAAAPAKPDCCKGNACCADCKTCCRDADCNKCCKDGCDACCGATSCCK
jgi:hypothetical protein